MNLTDRNMQVIENARLDGVRPGDHLVWEYTREVDGVTITVRREGVAHHRDRAGHWCTKVGMWITEAAYGGDLTIRRARGSAS